MAKTFHHSRDKIREISVHRMLKDIGGVKELSGPTLLAPPGRQATAAVERMPGVLLVQQTHQPQVRGRFLGGLVVQAGPSQTQQLALPTHAQLGMILVDQATLVSYRDRQLFF